MTHFARRKEAPIASSLVNSSATIRMQPSPLLQEIVDHSPTMNLKSHYQVTDVLVHGLSKMAKPPVHLAFSAMELSMEPLFLVQKYMNWMFQTRSPKYKTIICV